MTKYQDILYRSWPAVVVLAAFSIALTATLIFVIGCGSSPLSHLMILSLASMAPLAIALAFFAKLVRRHFLGPLHHATQELLNDQNTDNISSSSVTALAISSFIEAHNHRVANIKKIYEENAYLSQKAAVSHMTQMLAHDVRKPFSILRMGLSLLSTAQDSAGIKDILGRLMPEVKKAMGHVDGLIADIMEIGAPPSADIKESLSPQLLIEDAVSDIARMFPYAVVGITYDLKHHHNIRVNVQKSRRVVCNILVNAVQASGREFGKSGHIWIKTRDVEQYVEFCIANSGSQIPSANLPRVFDAFFTNGKKTGTGLGLAVAHKVVTEHGGKIWCRSHTTPDHPTGFVEFYFTLPKTDDNNAEMTFSPLKVGTLASEEGTLFDPKRSADGSPRKVDNDPNATHAPSTRFTHARLEGLDQPEVAVVEDNPFILDAWVETLSQDAKVHAASSPEALSQLLSNDPSLLKRLACVVTDLHFDNSSMNGVDIGQRLKRDRPNLPTLLSSDGWLSPDEMIGSIDHVIPKEPMTYRRLREFF